MSKDPAFLFYPGDWSGGTMHLDRYSKGCYIDVLILQFNRGHMTIDMIGQVLGQDMEKYWPKIQDKFKKDGENYYNEKLRTEIERRKAYTESRKNNLTGKNQHTKNKTGHKTNLMEDENTSYLIKEVISYLNEKTKSKYSPSTDKNKSLIVARLNQGYKLEDFKKVIDNKSAQWLYDENYSKYLRPETLFGTKFEGYLNEKVKRGISYPDPSQ